MRQINASTIAGIGGGSPLILYPIVGCTVYTGAVYISNPNASYGQLGKGCLKGAINSANPAFGLTGGMSNAVARYGVSAIYGAGIHTTVESVFPEREKELGCITICPSDLSELRSM